MATMAGKGIGMSRRRRKRQAAEPLRRPGWQGPFVVAGVLLVIGLVALMPLVAKPGPDRTEIVLIARDMGFYLDGRADRNPRIRVKPGSEIRLVLRNDDAGISHDFVVGSLGWTVPGIDGRGERAVVVRAPDRPGVYEYTCTPHPAMMRGVLEVGDAVE